MRKFFALLVMMVCAFGCSSGGNAVKGGSQSDVPIASLIGHYKGEMKKTAGKDDVAGQMAESMGSMFASMMQLDILEGNQFKMSMMGVPVEGPYSVTGNQITLTPKKVMGMTPEEAQRANPSAKIDTKPLKGVISADGSITIAEEDPTKGQLVFSREKATPEGKKTVQVAEAKLVGDYVGSVLLPSEASSEEKNMAAAMSGNLKMKLRNDNTFQLNIIIDLEGTWSVSGDRLMTKTTKVMGMTPTEAKKNGTTVDELVGEVSKDGQTITLRNAKGKDKGAFVFKRNKKASESH